MTIQLPITRTIVLVGMMGSGKSAVGRRLAPKLSMPFIDADTEIERAAGCSIAEIFDRHGEEEFRSGESRVIARLLTRPAHVLATGGGAFMNKCTRALISTSGISIWLRADLEVLFQRVKRKSNRPILKTEDQRTTLTQLLELRNPIYACADLIVESTDAPLEQTVENVLEALRIYLAEPNNNE